MFFRRTGLWLLQLCALWLCTQAASALPPNEKLTQFGRQNWQTENGLPQNTIHAILQSPSGFLWIGTDGGLVRFDGYEFVTYDTRNTPELADNSIDRLVLDAAGGLWFSTPRGIGRWHDDKPQMLAPGAVPAPVRELLRASPMPAIALPSAPGRITAQLRDRDGVTWIGTENGLARSFGGEIERFPAGDPLSTDAINALFEDREGDIWIGGDSSGLTELRRQKFVTYSFRQPEGSPQIRCVLGARDGAIWIGTDGGGLKKFQDGRFTTITIAQGLSSNVILSLAAAPDGTIYAGTPDGINRIANGSLRAVRDEEHVFAEDFIRSIYVDRDGSLWIGTRRGLSHVAGGQVKTYTQADGLGSDTVGALLRDSGGTLWIGTLHGLSRLEDSRIGNHTTAQGLSGNVITDLFEDDRGRLWIATQDGGLSLYQGGSFRALPHSDSLPQAIYGISEDSAGNLWMVAKGGVFRASADDLARSAPNVSAVAYGTSDGLRVSEGSGSGHPAIWKTRTGDLWFATANGAALLRSAEQSLNRVPPPVAIESVSIDDAGYFPNQIRPVAPGKTRISFEYAGMSFLAPQKVTYKYRLEGFDKNWIDAGTRRVAYYTNLPPRSYRFRVIAGNNDGFWNNIGASLSIRVLPHFYQTWWFDLLVLAAVALALYALYVWRLQQLQARFEAVLAERNRIAREIHDTLAQGFVGVSVQLELVSRLLTNSTESAREHLDQARILVRRCLAEARQSIWELRSQAADRDFAARFSKLAQQVSESGPVKVQFEVQGQYRALKPVLEDELFRIGQEAITNAVRHSGAQQVRVTLTFDSRKLRMTIADNGCGFSGVVNSQGPDGHFGLQGMRERAERIHAQLNLESAPGVGTTISVEAPAR